MMHSADLRPLLGGGGQPLTQCENCDIYINWGSSCELIISAHTFYMASLLEKDAEGPEEDHGDAGLTTSRNGQEYPLHSVFSTQRTEARGEPWCPWLLVGDLRSSVMSLDLGKARQVARLRRRGGGTWGRVFPPVNMIIANPHGAKRKLNWVGGQKITGVAGWTLNPRQFSPCLNSQNK